MVIHDLGSWDFSQVPFNAFYERAAYASNYALVKCMGDFNMKEFELLSELNTLSRPTVITEVAQDRLRLTIS